LHFLYFLFICLFSDSDVSRNSEISLQSYLRTGSTSTEGQKDAQGDDVMGVGDIYLGGVKLVPDFEKEVSQKGEG
jgi:serum/glucocorticoid-regulated kinase 2